MSGGIYLIQDNDRLVEMTEQAYATEDQLQELLEKYPNLLAGDRIDRAAPRQWLAVWRETSLVVEEESVERWSFDRLFVDRDAIPTLVEVRRSTHADARRNTIGQILDYAANIGIFWPIESIVTHFEANCRSVDRDPEQVFEAFIGDDASEELFWQKVDTNLRAGKIRLAIVADEIPVELQRVVEFLNQHMNPVEIFAVEIKQYVSEDGLRTLVPRIVGQTARPKAIPERRKWEENSFFHEFAVRNGKDEAEIAKAIYDWALDQLPTMEIHWGKGEIYGGFAIELRQPDRKPYEIFSIGIHGVLQIYSKSYAAQPPFNNPESWQELRERMSSIGLALPTNAEESRLPYFMISTLSDGDTLQKVFSTFEWVVGRIRSGA